MKRVLSMTAVLVVLVAAFAIGWAIHDTPSPATATTSAALTAADPLTLAASAPSGSNKGTGSTAQQRYESFVAAVAAKAGVSTKTLDTAIRDVAAQRVADAAKAGVINQNRATKVENAIKNGTLGHLIQRLHQKIAAARGHGHHPLLHWLRRILLQ